MIIILFKFIYTILFRLTIRIRTSPLLFPHSGLPLPHFPFKTKNQNKLQQKKKKEADKKKTNQRTKTTKHLDFHSIVIMSNDF